MVKKEKKPDVEIDENTIGGGFPPFIIIDIPTDTKKNLLRGNALSISKILSKTDFDNTVIPNIDEELINVTTL